MRNLEDKNKMLNLKQKLVFEGFTAKECKKLIPIIESFSIEYGHWCMANKLDIQNLEISGSLCLKMFRELNEEFLINKNEKK